MKLPTYMKRFAANRIYRLDTQQEIRNGVVELEDTSHEVLRTFSLEEEIQHTEWLGGLILICKQVPQQHAHEKFAAFMTRIKAEESSSESSLESTLFHAYHITAFNVSSMEFTQESRIVAL